MGPRLGRVPGRFPARILLLCVSLLHERVAAVSYILAYRFSLCWKARCGFGNRQPGGGLGWEVSYRRHRVTLAFGEALPTPGKALKYW